MLYGSLIRLVGGRWFIQSLVFFLGACLFPNNFQQLFRWFRVTNHLEQSSYLNKLHYYLILLSILCFFIFSLVRVFFCDPLRFRNGLVLAMTRPHKQYRILLFSLQSSTLNFDQPSRSQMNNAHLPQQPYAQFLR